MYDEEVEEEAEEEDSNAMFSFGSG